MNFLREHRLLQVTWCDDIREEVGSKLSFMGIYDRLVVPSTPFVIPRLAAHLMVYTPIGRPIKKVSFRLFKSDEEKPLAVGDLDIPPATPVAGTNDEDPATVSFVSLGVLVGNISITETTHWLQAEVNTGDETLQSLKLRIGHGE